VLSFRLWHTLQSAVAGKQFCGVLICGLSPIPM
jgi:hypothetical protein